MKRHAHASFALVAAALQAASWAQSYDLRPGRTLENIQAPELHPSFREGTTEAEPTVLPRPPTGGDRVGLPPPRPRCKPYEIRDAYIGDRRRPAAPLFPDLLLDPPRCVW
jgi:hypothetical protein